MTSASNARPKPRNDMAGREALKLGRRPFRFRIGVEAKGADKRVDFRLKCLTPFRAGVANGA
jgi:hypothetical protein